MELLDFHIITTISCLLDAGHHGTHSHVSKKAQSRFDKKILENYHAHEHVKVQKANLAHKFVDAFLPIQILLAAVGQFPLHHKKDKKEGTYNFKFFFLSPHAVMFYFVTIVQFLLIIIMFYNSITIFTNTQYFDTRRRNEAEVNQTRLYELVLLARYRHTYITIWVNVLSFMSNM